MKHNTPIKDRVAAYSKTLPNGCIEWTRSKIWNGYGHIVVKGKHYLAHRLAYELAVGKIPDGMVLDHLCRNRLCINPEHLEPVTRKENILRGVAPHVLIHHTGRCAKGHPMHRMPSGRIMACKTCNNEAVRRYKARKAA